jgi:hypothetical protein
VAFRTPDISTFSEVMRNVFNRWLSAVPHFNLRFALIQKSLGSLPQAISVMEQYARTGLAPLPYSLLHDWYLECNEKSKAQDALERGVKARDPKAVVKRVKCVGSLYTRCPAVRPLQALILRREMLRADEPDVSLATTLLQAVREDEVAGELWWELTSPCFLVGSDDTAIAVQRLRQTSPAYPLREIEVLCASSKLLPALGAATTLESVCIDPELPNDFKSQIASQLKAVPSLRAINLIDFPMEAGLNLLRSRKNWEQIRLPKRKTYCRKASALAARNETAFRLETTLSESYEDLLGVTNPHLTALRMAGAIPVNVWYELGHCKNLTNLVRSCLALDLCASFLLGFLFCFSAVCCVVTTLFLL